MKPLPIDGLNQAFPTSVDKHLPKYNEVPEEFRRGHTPWNKLFSKLFYSGGSVAHLVPKPGIDKAQAIAHIRYCMGSWEPKHEHKEAGVAYLFSLWFEPVEKSNP